MTPIDAGPIVALLDTSDPYHSMCLQAAQKLHIEQMVTTWPCFAEAMYLLGSAGGYRYQERLWRIRRDGRLDILEMTTTETDRCDALMRQYQDRPMDLADASLVAVAEGRNFRSVFTIDDDFYFYVLADGSVLEIVR